MNENCEQMLRTKVLNKSCEQAEAEVVPSSSSVKFKFLKFD